MSDFQPLKSDHTVTLAYTIEKLRRLPRDLTFEIKSAVCYHTASFRFDYYYTDDFVVCHDHHCLPESPGFAIYRFVAFEFEDDDLCSEVHPFAIKVALSSILSHEQVV